MIVSWNWLKDFLDLDLTHEEVALRLAMAGLNHEGTEAVGNDFAIDLEVTSNRPDCLGHLGVAREIAVQWDRNFKVPEPQPASGGSNVDELVSVEIECPELCPRYTARVIRGVKIAPSPQWLQDHLKSIGIETINNVVDITNYVMMECGQPLHAFDLAKVQGAKIIVRQAKDKESFEAINHRSYELDSHTCVIADTERALAIGGVMGGADSEVSETTQDVLIEAADFDCLAVRRTARKLKLFSPSSYRFERTVDPNGIDWASRRCAELILEHAGGQLAEGVADVQPRSAEPPAPVTLRLHQIPRVLGIQIEQDEIQRILSALGNEIVSADTTTIKVQPPSWRRDLGREIDLIEELARIHGYEKIPEDVGVAMAPSQKSPRERVAERVRSVMTAVGFDEAMTTSVVTEEASTAMSFWSNEPALRTVTPMLRGADHLRRSLIPSLMQARKTNESLQNEDVELFEVAKIYLPKPGGLPEEIWMLGLVSEGSLLEVKGKLETLIADLTRDVVLTSQDADLPSCGGQSCQLTLGTSALGYLGELDDAGRKPFGLRRRASFAEIRLDCLQQHAELIPQYRPQSVYPAISRDFNFIVDESVRWADLAETVGDSCGNLLERMDYRETFRDAEKDGDGKKRLLFTYYLRAPDRTLTREEAEEISAKVVDACGKQHAARLL